MLRGLGGLGQRTGRGFEFGRRRGDAFDDVADRALEFIREPAHIGFALGDRAQLGLLLLFLHADLGEAVILEHERGFRDVADLVPALGAGDLDVVVAAGQPLQHHDQIADRLGDPVLADEEAQSDAENDADCRDNDHELRNAGIFVLRLLDRGCGLLVEVLDEVASHQAQLVRDLSALHGFRAELVHLLGHLKIFDFAGQSQRRRQLTLVIGPRGKHGLQHRFGRVVRFCLNVLHPRFEELCFVVDVLLNFRPLFRARIGHNAKLCAAQRDDVLHRAGRG